MIRLHRALHIDENLTAADSGLVVIVEDQGRRYALKVDELLGQQQVVIKNLETNFRKVPGVAGATILGDGRVALILDIFGISNLPCGDNKRSSASGSQGSEPGIASKSTENNPNSNRCEVDSQHNQSNRK